MFSFNFTDPQQEFNFVQGRVTEILECDPEDDTATFVGTIRRMGQTFDVTVEIILDPVSGERSVIFTANNQNPEGTPETFIATLTDADDPTASLVDIDPCPRT